MKYINDKGKQLRQSQQGFLILLLGLMDYVIMLQIHNFIDAVVYVKIVASRISESECNTRPMGAFKTRSGRVTAMHELVDKIGGEMLLKG